MNLDRRASELGMAMEAIVKQFQAANAAACSGPHASLNHQEMRLIAFLGERGAQMMRVVAEHLALAVNSVTTVADGLEAKDLVRRQRSAADRRIVNVELTERGARTYRSLRDARQHFFRSLLKPLTSAEQETLLEIFQKVVREGEEPPRRSSTASRIQTGSSAKSSSRDRKAQ